MKINKIEAKGFADRDQTARIELTDEYEDTYYSLEEYGQAKGVNPAIVSRLLKEYEGREEALTTKVILQHTRKITVFGNKFKNQREMMRHYKIKDEKRYNRVKTKLMYDYRVAGMMVNQPAELDKNKVIELTLRRLAMHEVYSEAKKAVDRIKLDIFFLPKVVIHTLKA